MATIDDTSAARLSTSAARWRRTRPLRWALGALLAIIAGIVLVAVGPIVFPIAFRTVAWVTDTPLEFDPHLWKENRSGVGLTPVRARMVDSLLKSRVLEGASKPEVIALLGPDSIEHPSFGEGHPHTPSFATGDLAYVLAPTFTDHTWLLVLFDDDDRVAWAGVRED